MREMVENSVSLVEGCNRYITRSIFKEAWKIFHHIFTEDTAFPVIPGYRLPSWKVLRESHCVKTLT